MLIADDDNADVDDNADGDDYDADDDNYDGDHYDADDDKHRCMMVMMITDHHSSKYHLQCVLTSLTCL